MPGVDVATGTLTVPIWMAGAVSAVFVVAIVLAIGKAGAAIVDLRVVSRRYHPRRRLCGWIYMQRARKRIRPPNAARSTSARRR